MEKVKTLIIGGGPAGYTAAIYAGYANTRSVSYSGLQPGSRLTTTTIIENFPGFHEGTDTSRLMSEIRGQAKFCGADLRGDSIVKADLNSRLLHLENECGNQIEAKTVTIATGASAKYLGLPDGERYRGQDVGVCATCDNFFYRKRTVVVVGGGDTVCEETIHLSGLAKKVYMIMHKPQLRAAEIIRKRVTEKESVEILYNTNTLGLFDEGGVEGVHLVRFKGEENEKKLDTDIGDFLLAVGHTPNTDLFKGQLKVDDHGFIITKPEFIATNIEGIFAADDVVDLTYHQGVVAAGIDVVAAIEADYLLQKQ